MKAYKGFDKNMQCRGFQFEEGKTYELPEGETAKLCKRGFHACENPLDCWEYYNLLDSEFHEVELEDVADEKANDTKVCGRKITIGAKLDIKGIVQASIEFVMNSVKSAKRKSSMSDAGKDGAKIGSSGDGAKIGSSGDGAQIGSSGVWAQIGSSGNGAQIGSSGEGAQIGSSGDGAKIGSSGDGAKIGSSGDGAQIGSSGDGAKTGSSGDRAQIDVSGERCVASCVGNNGMIRAKIGDWIVLSEWKNIDGNYTPVCVKSGQIDGKTLKPDTWYTLKDGEFKEET